MAILRVSALLAALLTGFHLFSQPAETKRPPHVVRTGVYLLNLYDLNMRANSFYADFYVWFKWKGSFDPSQIEFVNAIEKWSMSAAAFGDSSTVTLLDGTHYKIFRVEGRFYHGFALNRFPLDAHALDIQIENPEADADSILYLPDTSGALVRPSLQWVGWENRGCRLQSRLHDYGTNFGNPEENARRYSNLTFSLTLGRPFNFFLLKMLLPVIVVMIASIGALLLFPTHIDTRASLPIGGLLTAVFLQQLYIDSLPDTGYMNIMDKIYLLAYLLISLVLLQIIVAGNILSSGDAQAIARQHRYERWLAVLLFAAFGIGVIAIC
jgi:hypothetical protein